MKVFNVKERYDNAVVEAQKLEKAHEQGRNQIQELQKQIQQVEHSLQMISHQFAGWQKLVEELAPYLPENADNSKKVDETPAG